MAPTKKMRTPEKHGDTHAPLYKKWRTMRLRINYPDTNGYENYGGRGIKICDRWSKYSNFKEDMGPTFIEGLTLDRKDPDGDYCKDNCKWSTRDDQQRSKRKHIRFNDELVCVYARREGIKYNTAVYNLRKYGHPKGKQINE